MMKPAICRVAAGKTVRILFLSPARVETSPSSDKCVRVDQTMDRASVAGGEESVKLSKSRRSV